MSSEMDEKFGVLKISDDVIAIAAANATLKTEGIADLSGGFSDNFSKNILGKEPLYKGIKVSQSDEGIVIDIFVVIKYNVKIPAVAWDVQNNVKREIEHMTGEKVLAVNIHVQGVHILEEGEHTYDEK